TSTYPVDVVRHTSGQPVGDYQQRLLVSAQTSRSTLEPLAQQFRAAVGLEVYADGAAFSQVQIDRVAVGVEAHFVPEGFESLGKPQLIDTRLKPVLAQRLVEAIEISGWNSRARARPVFGTARSCRASQCATTGHHDVCAMAAE